MNRRFIISDIGYYISKKYMNGPRSPLRTTEGYEVELYTTDNGISVVDEKEYPHTKGNILISKPNQQRYSKDSFECYYVHFICLEDDFEADYLKRLPQIINSFDMYYFSEIFKLIITTHANADSGYELCLEGCLLQMISKLFYISHTYKQKNNKYSQYQYQIYMVSKFMEDNFSKPLTLMDMASAVNLSPSFLHLIFKNTMKKTPRQYLLNIRLTAAKNLLVNSNKSIAEIAEICGFDSQPYLNYIFKKELNTTPKKYRDSRTIIL